MYSAKNELLSSSIALRKLIGAANEKVRMMVAKAFLMVILIPLQSLLKSSTKASASYEFLQGGDRMSSG